MVTGSSIAARTSGESCLEQVAICDRADEAVLAVLVHLASKDWANVLALHAFGQRCAHACDLVCLPIAKTVVSRASRRADHFVHELLRVDPLLRRQHQ